MSTQFPVLETSSNKAKTNSDFYITSLLMIYLKANYYKCYTQIVHHKNKAYLIQLHYYEGFQTGKMFCRSILESVCMTFKMKMH